MPQVRCVGLDDAHCIGFPVNCHHLRCSGRSRCLYRSCERRQHGCASHQSNGSRQRLRRVQRRAVLSVIVPGSARSKVRAFGTKSRRDAHYGVTDQSDQQPEANLRKRPCHHESRYEGQFERRVSRYPELPSRYPRGRQPALLCLVFERLAGRRCFEAARCEAGRPLWPPPSVSKLRRRASIRLITFVG